MPSLTPHSQTRQMPIQIAARMQEIDDHHIRLVVDEDDEMLPTPHKTKILNKRPARHLDRFA